ncbi:hypothetical protein DITRI_Ditri09bG0140100 [Diplodiscus trichospermus]
MGQACMALVQEQLEEGFHPHVLLCTKFAGQMVAMMLTFSQHWMMQLLRGLTLYLFQLDYLLIKDYFMDPIAIGAFHAMKYGVLTVKSSGNDGLSPSSISSNSPWLLSVAASTIDRKFFTSVQLGSSEIYEGKIVLCDSNADNGAGTLLAGAIGTVMRDQAPKDYATLFALPGSYLDLVIGNKIFRYMNSTR